MPAGTPKLTYWGITVGGTLVSIVIGVWLGRRGDDRVSVAATVLAETDASE